VRLASFKHHHHCSWSSSAHQVLNQVSGFVFYVVSTLDIQLSLRLQQGEVLELVEESIQTQDACICDRLGTY
jgi:hypothetical protein